MSAPTLPDLPELPVFPSARGLPDQPAQFFAKLFSFLTALSAWRAALQSVTAWIEANSGGGSGGSGGGESTVTIVASGGFRPMVTGDNPPVFIINDEHDLIMTEI